MCGWGGRGGCSWRSWGWTGGLNRNKERGDCDGEGRDGPCQRPFLFELDGFRLTLAWDRSSTDKGADCLRRGPPAAKRPTRSDRPSSLLPPSASHNDRRCWKVGQRASVTRLRESRVDGLEKKGQRWRGSFSHVAARSSAHRPRLHADSYPPPLTYPTRERVSHRAGSKAEMSLNPERPPSSIFFLNLAQPPRPCPPLLSTS